MWVIWNFWQKSDKYEGYNKGSSQTYNVEDMVCDLFSYYVGIITKDLL